MNKQGVRDKYSARIGQVVECGEETKTQQHFKDQCDINKIVRNIDATGSSDHVKMARERYGDFTEVYEVGINMDKAAKAQQLFEQLPAELRKKMGHSIPEFFEYIGDKNNFDECVKWGIFDKPKEAPAGKPGGATEVAVPPGSNKDGSQKQTKVITEGSDT